MQENPGRTESIWAGELEIRPDSLVMARGRPVVLSRREHDLLRELANRQGRVLTREEIFRAVWGRAFDPADRSVDVYVRKLRVKLARALPAWNFIHTHPGFGYRFSPEPASQLVHEWDTAR